MTADEVWQALEQVIDPELGQSIVKLGLVYRVELQEEGLRVDFTLTSFACPLADQLAAGIRDAVASLDKDTKLDLHLVWDPPWNPDMMDEELRFEFSYLI